MEALKWHSFCCLCFKWWLQASCMDWSHHLSLSQSWMPLYQNIQYINLCIWFSTWGECRINQPPLQYHIVWQTLSNLVLFATQNQTCWTKLIQMPLFCVLNSSIRFVHEWSGIWNRPNGFFGQTSKFEGGKGVTFGKIDNLGHRGHCVDALLPLWSK